jgi:hypothetical protein
MSVVVLERYSSPKTTVRLLTNRRDLLFALARCETLTDRGIFDAKRCLDDSILSLLSSSPSAIQHSSSLR